MPTTFIPQMLAVAIYGPHGLMDRRPADDEADAIRVTVEMVRERSGLRAGERIEIQPFTPVRYAPLGEATSEACEEMRKWQRERAMSVAAE